MTGQSLALTPEEVSHQLERQVPRGLPSIIGGAVTESADFEAVDNGIECHNTVNDELPGSNVLGGGANSDCRSVHISGR